MTMRPLSRITATLLLTPLLLPSCSDSARARDADAAEIGIQDASADVSFPDPPETGRDASDTTIDDPDAALDDGHVDGGPSDLGEAGSDAPTDHTESEPDAREDAPGPDLGDAISPDCPGLLGAPAGCSVQWYRASGEACPEALCLDEACGDDSDCPLPATGEAGGYCVLGSCALCWDDDGCVGDQVCRLGRCVPPPAECPAEPDCTDPGCSLVDGSESLCPVCVCDSTARLACAVDNDCRAISSHRYQGCVYGRCADCRQDDDCDHGRCLPPGICADMAPHPETLYGIWLIGWHGGLDHFSYFRFEPDGTLRRGAYVGEVAWSDDIPQLPCGGEWPLPGGLVGTWEPEITESAFLVVRLTLNVGCDTGDGWRERFRVTLSEDDDRQATFQSVDRDSYYQGYRIPADRCVADMSTCEPPGWPP